MFTDLKYVLVKNVFSFNNQFYQQLHGVAMGTKVAPALATIYLAQIEEEFLLNSPHKPVIWYQYIDDILKIWTEGIVQPGINFHFFSYI